MWRAFVTSVIAAVSLQYIDPFGTAKLVLFQVTSVSDTWQTFELVRLYFSPRGLKTVLRRSTGTMAHTGSGRGKSSSRIPLFLFS